MKIAGVNTCIRKKPKLTAEPSQRYSVRACQINASTHLFHLEHRALFHPETRGCFLVSQELLTFSSRVT